MSNVPSSVTKRQRTASTSTSLSPQSASKASRISPSESTTHKEIICKLPPTCHVKPTVLDNSEQLESHYSRCHTHICAEDNCGFLFPEPKFLELHQNECHDPIAAIRKENGERTFGCFDSNCDSLFRTPKGRRLHLIDKHKYPSNFYFAVTNYGIGRSLSKWGEGVSMLRKEWKPRSVDALAESMDTGETKVSDPAVDLLADTMSSLSLIPPSIHFGRGGSKAGFGRAPRGTAVRGISH